MFVYDDTCSTKDEESAVLALSSLSFGGGDLGFNPLALLAMLVQSNVTALCIAKHGRESGAKHCSAVPRRNLAGRSKFPSADALRACGADTRATQKSDMCISGIEGSPPPSHSRAVFLYGQHPIAIFIYNFYIYSAFLCYAY